MQAIVWALIGFFSFTLMDLSIKWLLQSYSLMQVTFFNCLFGLLGLLIWVSPRFELLRTRHWRVQALRAVLVLVADLCAFYSYGELPLAEAYTLILTMPLFVALFALLLGQEALRPLPLAVTLVGFVGICITLAPSFQTLQWALLAALATAIIEALSFLLINRYKAQETPQSFAVYGLTLVVAVTGILMLPDYKPMALMDWGISLGGGICYALATALVVTAFHRGSPTMVSSMQYSQLLWGMLLSFVIWQHTPSMRVLIGALLITIAGLVLLHSQKRTANPPLTQDKS